MRRALAVLASIGLGLGTVALASPASAQGAPLSFDSDNNLYIGTLQIQGSYSLSASGFSFQNDSGNPLQLESATPGYLSNSANGLDCNTPTNCQIPIDGRVNFTIEPQSSEDTVNILRNEGTGFVSKREFDVKYSSGGGGGGQSGSSDSGGSAPASEIQQFGLPASGNCEDGVTEAMNWSGIGMDGWGVSWAQWMNAGAGGAVCTRTVVYDTSTAKWTVN